MFLEFLCRHAWNQEFAFFCSSIYSEDSNQVIPGREPCTARAFFFPVSRGGVVSGFVFQRRSPGDTTLSERGQTESVLQGWHCITTNWATNWRVRTLRSGFDDFGPKPHRSGKRVFWPSNLFFKGGIVSLQIGLQIGPGQIGTNAGHVVWERGRGCSAAAIYEQIRVDAKQIQAVRGLHEHKRHFMLQVTASASKLFRKGFSI